MKKILSRIIQGRVMPGGWHVMTDNKVGGKTRIDGDTLPDVLEHLISYRLDNVIPLGDPLKDIEEYVCGNWPDFCHKVFGATVVVNVNLPSQPTRTLLDRIIIWIEAQTKNLSPEVLVTRDEAQRRAEICERCPMNVKWKESCSTCNENISRLVSVMRLGQSLPRDKKLLACSAFGHENRAAVWLKRERIGSVANLPSNCWATHS